MPTDRHRVALALFAVGYGANHFSALLLVYRADGYAAAVTDAMFGVYALGLIPALVLAGRLSDRIGRRRVLLPSLLLMAVASVVLLMGTQVGPLLYLGRAVAGAATGAAMASGTPWLRELSASRSPGSGARLAAVALSAGFGGGPLVSGTLAQWLPWEQTLPYLVHLALITAAIAAVRPVPDVPGAALLSVPGSQDTPVPLRPTLRSPDFLVGVLLWAPWVFGTTAIAFVTVAGLDQFSTGPAPVFLSGILAAVTLGTGVVLQPWAQRLYRRDAHRPTVVGLLTAALGLACAALAAASPAPLTWWMVLPIGGLLGAAYGILLASGLLQVERLAPRHHHGTLVSVYYALTYAGFALPFIVTLAGQLAPLWVWLLLSSAAALLTIPAVLAVARGRC